VLLFLVGQPHHHSGLSAKAPNAFISTSKHQYPGQTPVPLYSKPNIL
jgi:hypothetical protein